ncbi:MAG TPA: hypothetical protein VHB47_19280, partial [Thermoanaerobaculia bacterium]|nr:hypothetical protein [Thermoanaerobaculia bacterium]
MHNHGLHNHGLHRHGKWSSGVWWGCLLALAAAGGRPAAAQGPAETPIAPGAFPGGGSPLLTFGEDPNRQLVINGFGVLGYDYDFNTG